MVDFITPLKADTIKRKVSLSKYELFVYATVTLLGFFYGRVAILEFLNPFSVSFLCAFMIKGSYAIIISFGILLGSFSFKNPQMFLRHLIVISILLFIFILFRRTRVNRKLLFSIFGGIASFIAGYFIFYIRDYYLYDLLMLIMESIMICSLTIVYEKGAALITDLKHRRTLSTEEIVSISMLISTVFLGSAIYFWKLSLTKIMSIFIILMFSYVGSLGTGAVVGTALGVLQSLSGDVYFSAIGVYSLCGLLSGSLKKLGKSAMVIGFILGNSIMTFFINGSTEVLINFNEIAIASFLFLVFPHKSFKDYFNNNLFGGLKGVRDDEEKVKDYTIERLMDVSEVFKELSVSLSANLSSNNSFFSQIDAAEIIEKTAKDICYSCGMYGDCWKRDFYRTYQKVFDMLMVIESGKSKKTSNKGLGADKCLFYPKIWDSLSYNYNIYRSNHLWKKRLEEGRQAYGQQMMETSKLISDLAERLKENVEFNGDLEEQVIASLDGIGIDVKEVSVVENKETMEINIKLKSCGGKRLCINKILPELKKITGKSFSKTDLSCNIIKNDLCYLKLREVQSFSIVTGFVKRQKDTDTVSGDNFSFIEAKEGKFYMILSDGMGVGHKAALESSLAVNLLEKFISAGYDQSSALEAVNSFLLIKSNDENYATIDISVINQCTGEVEFLKVGGVSTFIKRGEKVDIIRNSSLPAGILNKIDVEFNRRKLKDGDFVIMVTDGVLDANKKALDKEGWLADLIEGISTRNPQKLADYILERCIIESNGEPTDDITVLVSKVWKPNH